MNMNTNTDKTNAYWGLLATLLLGILVFLVFSVVQTIGLFAYVYSVEQDAISQIGSNTNIEQLLNQYIYNGDAIAIAEIPAALIGVLLIIWFVSFRKPLSIDEYLDLNIPKIKPLLLFTGIMALLLVLMEFINVWFDRPIPEFMTQVYSNTNNLPLLWIAVVVAAPFFEEFLFRGFLFEGLSRSRLGLAGTIILTSAIWAVIHMQYGWFEIISIFFIGIVLCLAKIKSQSLYAPIILHMLMNLVASIGMEFMQ